MVELDFLEFLPELVDVPDEIDVLAHDAYFVLLVDLVVLDEVLLEHVDGLL